jgi:hypothetical protein
MSEAEQENAKAAPITLHGKLLEERLMIREYVERLEDAMSKGIYQSYEFTDKVLMCANLCAMRFCLWVLARRMKRL